MTTSVVRREMRDRVYAAFIEGTYARLLGEELPACPYTARTAVADSWELGWERTDDLPKVDEKTSVYDAHKILIEELDRGKFPETFKAVVHAVLELYERTIPDDDPSVNELLSIAGQHLEEIAQLIDDGSV